MRRKSHHFTKRKRDQLEALYNAGVSVVEIAALLGFSRQSIYKELNRGFYMHRNHDWTETKKYSADKAHSNARLMASGKGAPLKIGNDYEFAAFVEKMIRKKYSPAAILAYINENNLKFNTKVCRCTLYSYIDKGVFSISNKNLLRKGKMKRKKSKRVSKKICDITHSIESRAKEVLDRTSFGHWELDTVVGINVKSDTLLVLTERLSRMELIYRVPDKTSGNIIVVLDKLQHKLGLNSFRKTFKTITCDNGLEFSNHSRIEFDKYGRRRTSLFYCHPYSSWERGSNENQNAFIRRFIPKGIPISNYSLSRIREIQDYINTYPRAILGWKSSSDVFNKHLYELNVKNFL